MIFERLFKKGDRIQRFNNKSVHIFEKYAPCEYKKSCKKIYGRTCPGFIVTDKNKEKDNACGWSMGLCNFVIQKSIKLNKKEKDFKVKLKEFIIANLGKNGSYNFDIKQGKDYVTYTFKKSGSVPKKPH